jgi:hypothetical protein
VHNFHFPPENETISVQSISKPYITLDKFENNDYIISIYFNMNTKNKIENFIYYEGFIKIGDYEVPLNKNEISIRIDANKWLNDVYYIINGKWEYFNFDKQIISEDEKDNSIKYMFRFSKGKIKNKEIKIIIDEYNKNKRNTDLYLKYGIVINNELIINEINEKHIIEKETYNWNIFKVGIFWLFLKSKGYDF